MIEKLNGEGYFPTQRDIVMKINEVISAINTINKRAVDEFTQKEHEDAINYANALHGID